ncbi:MAG: hypothetical protein Q7U31_13050, partial [Anaerolineaceae bacterium]|nr:hypothetical protein [Anaerolineaceae bacterium]
AGLGLASSDNNFSSAGFLVLGVFCGSAAWWLLLSGVVGLFREKFGLKAMFWVNRISGMIILGFGIFALVSLIK